MSDKKFMGAPKLNPNFITDDLEIIDIFRQLMRTKEKLWTWQQVPSSSGSRPVHFSVVKRVDPIKKIVEVEPTTKDGFRFNEKNEIIIYSRKKNIAIKFKSKRLNPEYIQFSMPPRLNLLSPELAEKISVVEKENEAANMHLRSTPRKKTADGFVMLFKTLDETDEKSSLFHLYDISSGGMGLKTSDPGEFISGMTLRIVNINGKDLAKPMTGKVMSIREMPEDECFKVGVKFE
jgi:hypothetical protein